MMLAAKEIVATGDWWQNEEAKVQRNSWINA
jgi:hypothetical protein